MKFALINNTKSAATKNAEGKCPGCGAVLIAKCGQVKINHWAHKGMRNCDPWWENETSWHRNWKNNFPIDWQESLATDERSGEKHIADVRTAHGLVIEFQHSFIDPVERRQREQFYKKMIWIVDGTRLKRDYTRFVAGAKDIRPAQKQGHYLLPFTDECFPSNWLGSAVPVIFDFRGTETLNDPSDPRNALYYLYAKQPGTTSLMARVHRQSLINDITTGDLFKLPALPPPPPMQPPAKNTIINQRGQFPYVLTGGRFVRRRRF